MLCAFCHQGLSHCHGLLLLHADGSAECSEEPTCPGPAGVLHDFQAPCADGAGGACACLLVPA
jgi:hypothetical protein